MRTSLLVLFTILALISTVSCLTERDYQNEFSSFVKKFEKRYSHDQFFSKYNVFKTNLDAIHEHNAKETKSYTLGINEFADMSLEEFHSKMTGYKSREMRYLRSRNGPTAPLAAEPTPPATMDWRQHNAVTAVKNQGQCGSCWSFSTTGSTEGAHAIKNKNLVSLSEQQLMDCSTSYGDNGCNGGLMDDAFQYIIANGICSEASYPYQAVQGTCQTCTPVAHLASYVDIPTGVEADLLPAVGNHGPVSIAIEADSMAFQLYSGGVFDDASCGTNLDHGVLIVGYGTDSSSNKPYWIVKNSWGASWGESGYIRMVRGKNMCGLSIAASYPVSPA